MKYSAILLTVSALFFAFANPANAKKYWEKDILTILDPTSVEVKTECIGWFKDKWTGFKTCTEWAPRKRYANVTYRVDVSGPDSAKQAVIQIARTCGVVAFGVGHAAGQTASSAATPAAYPPAFYTGFKTGFWSCIKSKAAPAGMFKINFSESRTRTDWR
jgi:hypothetical protein